jgi:hypothetical protein
LKKRWILFSKNPYKIIVAFFLFVICGNLLAFNIFGPNNFDDCIIQGMKGVSSNAAADAIRNSCAQKFKDQSKDLRIETNNLGQRVCRVYWIGNGFTKETKDKRKGFVRYEIVYAPTQVLYDVALPEAMIAEFEKEKGKSKEDVFKKKIVNLIVDNHKSIEVACGL